MVPRRVVGGGRPWWERSRAWFRLGYVSNPGTGWSVYVEPEAHAAVCVIESCHEVLEEGVAEQVDPATLLEPYIRGAPSCVERGRGSVADRRDCV